MNTQSSTIQHTPTSHLQLGVARVDITPPVGIYHPMWGAARHHRATGIHRPLYADILYFAPLVGDGAPWVQVQMDMVSLGSPDQHREMQQAIAEGSGVAPEQVILAFSHTHSGGLFSPDRVNLPGGELIMPYLDDVRTRVRSAAAEAAAGLDECYLTYGTGRCNLAANRDYWDTDNNIYACGLNPDAPADDTLLVMRATTTAGTVRATLVNYACHPTTLAWENTQISPDYVGALRATVEDVTGAPCIFTLGACGDLGPRKGFVGDTAVADANGRQVAYAALSTLVAMDPTNHDFAYLGPVISGATLGTWQHVPQTGQRATNRDLFSGGSNVVDLQQKPLPDPAQLERDMQSFLMQQAEADQRGDTVAARDFGARVERARRWLNRLRNLPEGPTYPYAFTVRRLGDAYWVSVGGEPYNALQTELRAAFPDHPIIVTVLAGEPGASYLLTAESYGKGLYQEEPAILAAGCLEKLTGVIKESIGELHHP